MRCPVCRADSNEGPNCRRCRADLSMLFQLEDQRANLLRLAHHHAASGNWGEVARHANQAQFLRQGEDTFVLLSTALLMQSDYSEAWIFHQEKRAPGTLS